MVVCSLTIVSTCGVGALSNLLSIVWFRFDLRLHDNQALFHAVAQSKQIVPVYIWSPEEEGSWIPGAASRWWLHQSLDRLGAALRKCGSRLLIRAGSAQEVLRSLVKETDAQCVFWNRRYDPCGVRQDKEVELALRACGVAVETFNANLLHEPQRLRTRDGNPFRVFTPFWNQFSATLEPVVPVRKPTLVAFPDQEIDSLPLEQLSLEPAIDRAAGMRACWSPGEAGAEAKLKQFLTGALPQYSAGRDRPDQDGVSMLSPHLHFGEIGPRQIWHAVQELPVMMSARESRAAYLRELGWREFAQYILFHFPGTADHPLRVQFERFPWSNNYDLLRVWQQGQTGYPIVDAGMRQLWQTGWMHNRVRMIVASFLTKDLLISWTHGARWFWDTLVDADLGSNTLGWQWAAGCGADAAPYFRIFNPVLQGEKFDPSGEYVKRWVPELAALPVLWIHKPWKAPADVLLAAKVELGLTYPKPVIDHSWARKRALDSLMRNETNKDS